MSDEGCFGGCLVGYFGGCFERGSEGCFGGCFEGGFGGCLVGYLVENHMGCLLESHVECLITGGHGACFEEFDLPICPDVLFDSKVMPNAPQACRACQGRKLQDRQLENSGADSRFADASQSLLDESFNQSSAFEERLINHRIIFLHYLGVQR